MSFTALLLLSLGLAMDAFAVAATTGMRLGQVTLGQVFRMGGTFGLFQGLMPLLGWLLGAKAQPYIESYDHWLAFALLLFVGGRMLKEAWENRNVHPDECDVNDTTKGKELLLLGIAVSIDALAVGISFAMLNNEILLPALVIALVCFVITVMGLYVGRVTCLFSRLRNMGNYANVLGGVVLICIGLGILYEHSVFS